jgi:succinate-semialdehyde dehydrogenase / glutarate-semialdehyde dehydrogenase
VLHAQRESFAGLMCDEMGKPLAQALGEIDKCAWLCGHFAKHGPGMLAPEVVATEAKRSYVQHMPLGVVLALMPWNFPWWQVLRFAVPALLVGNTVLLRHAANTTGCALMIEGAVRAAGFPPGCLETVIVKHETAAELIADPRVAGVSLTGSTRAGREVGAVAGRSLKKMVLELGGSDPYLVLADADLEQAAEICVRARLHNGGQTCVAAKRWIVVESVATRFCELTLEHMRHTVMGPPRDPTTTLGPLARLDLRAELHDQATRSVAAGAKLLLGGTLPIGPGAYYPATLLDHVRPGMPAADEELFGPVAAILRVRDEDEAISVANRSNYGLGAAVFTRDVERGEAIARDRLEAGCCFVNAQVKSDPRLPFGGIKESGLGRELGRAGLLEFVNHKTVWVE